MRMFAQLYHSLDATTKTTRKVAAMREYFDKVEPGDGAWAVYFLSGRRLKRLIPAALFRRAGAEAAGIGEWLLEECYDAVGDLAETIALLLPHSDAVSTGSLAIWIETIIKPLENFNDQERLQQLHDAWSQLPTDERFVFNKLVTGAFRVGVSQKLVTRALSDVAHVDTSVIAHRLMGEWQPSAEFFHGLISPESDESDHSRPYPFCLAHPLQAAPETLGELDQWLVEWKWDGIRGQIVRRRDDRFLWSRGEELIREQFPEVDRAMQQLPDGTVLDGEVLGWKNGQVLSFSQLQRRIGRKSVGKKLLVDVPVRFMAFDFLEQDGHDLRQQPLAERRQRLEQLGKQWDVDFSIQISPLVREHSWNDLAKLRETSRSRNVEGFMLKRVDSEYAVGRKTGLWWKWKVDPYTCDAILIYAQRGTGRRASLYTDYTFAVWNEGALVPFAKAYSGLTDEEIREVDRFVRNHIVEKFGPVRAVQPQLVFELAFENIQASKRHKSGVAVRFPRIVRWRRDKKPEDADTLQHVQQLVTDPS